METEVLSEGDIVRSVESEVAVGGAQMTGEETCSLPNITTTAKRFNTEFKALPVHIAFLYGA